MGDNLPDNETSTFSKTKGTKLYSIPVGQENDQEIFSNIGEWSGVFGMNWAVLRNSPLKPLVSLASKVAKRVRRLWGRDITAMPVLTCLLSLISLIVSINPKWLAQ